MKLLFLVLTSLVFCCLWSCRDTLIKDESAKANAFFDSTFDASVDRSPEYQTEMGIKKDYDKWDDISDENSQKEHAITENELDQLKKNINYDLLDEQTKLSYDLYVLNAERDIKNFKYRFHNYPVNQMYGIQAGVPTFLLNYHQIKDSSDAQNYIKRVAAVDKLFSRLLENLKIREHKNIIPPKFVFVHVLRDIENVKDGRNVLENFKTKVSSLQSLSAENKKKMVRECEETVNNYYKPAYQSLKEYLTELQQKATDEAGVWKFPDGRDFYKSRLEYYTTSSMSADEIHRIGLEEVKRIHSEMDVIKDKVGFKGTLQEFFQFMRTDKQFYYPNTDQGRKDYLARATEIIETMKTKLPQLFITLPKAQLVVKRVEPFREQSAGKAFYNEAALDGSRPAVYYANLYNMADMPTYQMEALAYHEGIPGHHMQIAIAQELKDLPKFRKFGRFTAYVEGWGLYSEFTPKELGFYDDPYSDFGRLAMELWRACRLVVDTGIHAKKWTREEGIEYYHSNTPNPQGDAVKMVERHIVAAGQATAYKIGMLKILELRKKAKKELAGNFDIRKFHEVILTSGPIPLSVLEKKIDDWIIQNKI
jgi:uncharacterized protein (DUF885 family)